MCLKILKIPLRKKDSKRKHTFCYLLPYFSISNDSQSPITLAALLQIDLMCLKYMELSTLKRIQQLIMVGKKTQILVYVINSQCLLTYEGPESSHFVTLVSPGLLANFLCFITTQSITKYSVNCIYFNKYIKGQVSVSYESTIMCITSEVPDII